MKLQEIHKVREGKYLKNYELIYENRAGHEKKYEIVSHHEISDISELGAKVSGVSIVALYQGKILLLREFRMGVDRFIYNLCAGMKEEGETMEDCIRRELYEETGLSLKKIHHILNPAFAAVSICDILNQVAFVEAEGEINDSHMSENEWIQAAFYTKEEVAQLLRTEQFSSRAQIASWVFSIGGLDNL
ncbi:MAG: NUDIX hydrolase [Lachnospiraceae bacterium]|jgi:ADP-ribose pyrophosphatase|nr:NUDIX hydrolase [Lachnospiraceae bacterium]